jgi:hypothetical protein
LSPAGHAIAGARAELAIVEQAFLSTNQAAARAAL